MGRAEELFARLQRDGKAAVDELIEGAEAETTFLDFKGSRGTVQPRKLHDDAFKALAKGISGFGNTSGGLLLWGVDCRRNEQGGEVATDAPLPNALEFRTMIDGAVSRATYPAHPGVQSLFVPADDPAESSGYVAVLVPQASAGPLRSLGSNYYHIRAGTDFPPAPHEILAGMFGRGPRPSVDLNLIGNPVELNRHGDLVLKVDFVAVNFGMVLADRPYLSIWYNDLPRRCLNVAVGNSDDYVLRHGALPGVSLVGKPGVSVAPGAPEHMCDLMLAVPNGIGKDVVLDCVLGAEGAAPRRFQLRATEAEINAAHADARLGRGTSATAFLRLLH